jgi:2-aminoethylphosphonate-pyruvate transaminase
MPDSHPLPAARDALLFTPGPLTTSLSVKQAMLRDAGSWHWEFNAVVASIRERLLALAGLSRADGWEVIPLQGSGTFGVEAVFQSCVPPGGKVAVLTNGAYGERIVQMLQCAKIAHTVLRTAEDTPANPAALDAGLASDAAITHVALVHCETTTGILNPLQEVGRVARKHGKVFVVDAMSSFAGMPIDFAAAQIDFLISSANKCVEGVPGFSFVFAKRALLLASEGWARSLSLDLLGQFRGFERNGQFRYTPPTHVVLAFDQALRELEAEGGIAARSERYRCNHAALLAGMARLGFRSLLRAEIQSHIITAFRYPTPDFDFPAFYRRLAERGFITYPGKLTQVDTFRIGNIGRLFAADLEQLVAAIAAVLTEMGVGLGTPQP